MYKFKIRNTVQHETTYIEENRTIFTAAYCSFTAINRRLFLFLKRKGVKPMLGTFGTSAYNDVDDFNNHKDYLTYMYGGVKGFITRSVIPQERVGAYYETFNFADRLIYRNSYYGIENVYTSMNTFLTKRKDGDDGSGRKVENLKRLNALFLDLDCYKIGMSQEQVLFELENGYFGHNIPLPTFVINSGRGLYLIWKIDEDRNALPSWTSVEKYLFEQCKDFNADPQALDAARILRVPYSVNGKNGESVSIMRFNDVKYTLYDIIKEHDIKPQKWKNKAKNEPTYPYGEATEKQRRVAQWQATEFDLELPNFADYQETFDFIKANSNTHREDKAEKNNVIIFAKSKTINTMLDGRVNDLFKLFSLRTGGDCSREYALFLCRLWVGERTNDFTYALEQAQALNKTFDVPFDETYVEKRTKSAETKLKTRKTYTYGLPKLIEVLNITEAEQEELEYLCVQPQTQTARKKKSNRKAYLSRLEKEGKQTKADTVNERRETVATLIAEGKEKEEVCAIMNISARTFDRDKAAITANGLLARAITIVEETLSNIKDVTQNAAESLITAVENAAETVTKAVKSAQEAVSPFFKPTNYRRTPVGCSACASEDVHTPTGGLQLSLWDMLVFPCADEDTS